jgi:hypothetical protein
MTNSYEVKSLVVPLYATDWGGDDALMHLMRAPSSAQGGGVTILAAYLVPGAATNAGTAHSFQLENWGTAGTSIKTAGGTVAGSIGGTADVFAAQTPKTFTISNAFLDAGEWLVLRKNEDSSSDPLLSMLTVQYVEGK